MKDVYWMADTKEALSKFPDEVKNEIGFALYCEQIRKPHPKIKPLKGFKETVREIISGSRGNTYRAVYVVNIGDSLHILHVFQKRSKKGKATPKPDIDLIRKRLKQAREMNQ